MIVNQAELQEQVNKRLTLNLLIQGAASHTFLTAHHLVRDELIRLHPALPRLYDRLATSLLLNYFIGDIPLVFGSPSRFWSRVHEETSPFHSHPLFVEHGKALWSASKRYLIVRGRGKRIITVPVLHYFQAVPLVSRVAWIESDKRAELKVLAERTNAMIWNIDPDQLDAELTTDVAFGNVRQPATRIGQMVLNGAVGFGGVEHRNGKPIVVAKAWFWPLLLHELVKGTAELVCLHGLNELDDELYHQVLEQADHIEYETWMLQAGSELWRRFLAVKPPDLELAEAMMHVARLEPHRLQQVMTSVIVNPVDAKRQLASLI